MDGCIKDAMYEMEMAKTAGEGKHYVREEANDLVCRCTALTNATSIAFGLRLKAVPVGRDIEIANLFSSLSTWPRFYIPQLSRYLHGENIYVSLFR